MKTKLSLSIQNMFFARKSLFLFAVFLLQMSTASEFFAEVWLKTLGHIRNIVKKRKPLKMPNGSNCKLLSKDMSQFFGSFLKIRSAQKMKATSKQWSSVTIYENVFPDDYEVAVFRKVNTEKILWETIQFKKLRKPLPRQKELVSHLRRKGVAKWNDVFLWLAENDDELNTSQNAPFLKKLMLAVAENVPLTITAWFRFFPLRIAVLFDDVDSILTLIKRGANIYQKDNFGWTSLHVAASKGNVNACVALLDSNININVTTEDGWTPLMRARNKKMFEFLIDKGANKDLMTNIGQTASQLATFGKK
jgi:hypothetical protein